MGKSIRLFAFTLSVFLAGCATPPISNPAAVEPGCAQQCSSHLAICSSGFKLAPVIQQQQCNDIYDVCIKGCPQRTLATSQTKPPPSPTAERLKQLEELFKSGAITKDEYDAKRKEILGSL